MKERRDFYNKKLKSKSLSSLSHIHFCFHNKNVKVVKQKDEHVKGCASTGSEQETFISNKTHTSPETESPSLSMSFMGLHI